MKNIRSLTSLPSTGATVEGPLKLNNGFNTVYPVQEVMNKMGGFIGDC